MKKRNTFWIITIILLFISGAWLSYFDNTEKSNEIKKKSKSPIFPNYMRQNEKKRAKKRRRVFVKRSKEEIKENIKKEKLAKEPKDPILRAFGAGDPKDLNMVFEASSIQNSKIGKNLLDCIPSLKNKDFLAAQKKLGIDLFKDLDRIAVSKDIFMVSGHYKNVKWDKVFNQNDTKYSYGDRAKIYEETTKKGTKKNIAVWNNEIFIVSKNLDQLKETIDVIEGRKLMNSIPLDENQTYGEIYGIIPNEMMASLLPKNHKHLAPQFNDLGAGIEMHMDISKDINLTSKFKYGNNQIAAKNLAKTLGGGLALGLSYARASNEKKVATLLEHAKVIPKKNDFKMELALPESILGPYIEEMCKAMKEKDKARKKAKALKKKNTKIKENKSNPEDTGQAEVLNKKPNDPKIPNP